MAGWLAQFRYLGSSPYFRSRSRLVLTILFPFNFHHYPSQALKSSKCNNHYQKHTRCNPSCNPSRRICSRSFLSVFTQHYTMVVVHSCALRIQNQFSYAGDLKVCVTTRSLFCNLLYLLKSISVL
jgi:hypothetical protein